MLRATVARGIVKSPLSSCKPVCAANARRHNSRSTSFSHKLRLPAARAAIADVADDLPEPQPQQESCPECKRSAPLRQLVKHLENPSAKALLFFVVMVGLFVVPPPVSAAELATSGVKGVISFILHLGDHLAALIEQYGTAVYAILWGIVFCETGLVLTPFLPGDSLLFAAGAFAGIGKLNLAAISLVFISAAILGDAVNYLVGNKLGEWIQSRNLISPAHIKQTQKFYAKYGGKTIVLARFVPIVRTFAPFVAGVGSMAYSRFALYNVAGALLWTVLFVGAGFVFGNLPVVQKNFTLVVLGIVVLSVVPVVIEVINARKEAEAEKLEGSGPAGASPSA